MSRSTQFPRKGLLPCLVSVLAVLLLPACSPQPGGSEAAVCRNHLKELGILLKAYAAENSGEIPNRDNLEGWSMLGKEALQHLACPLLPDRRPTREKGDPYFYFGTLAGDPSRQGGNEIIAIEKRAHRNRTRQLLTQDGSVLTLEQEQPGLAYALMKYHRGEIDSSYRQRQIAKAEQWEQQQRTRQSVRRTRAEFRKYLFFAASSGLLLVLLAVMTLKRRISAAP